MKKSLLTIGMLAAFMSAKAQSVSYVADGTEVSVGEAVDIYNGGGLQTVGSGVLVNRGNILVDATSADAIRTYAADGLTNKTDGGNIILKLNDPTNFTTSTYGQLFISGIPQANITGIVDKEYAATKNGTMQQMAVPFYNKSLATLATDLGAGTFSSGRDGNAVGYWENERAVMHNLPGTATTLSVAAKDNRTAQYNNATRYYAVGTQKWAPETLHVVKGVPFSDTTPLVVTLYGAGYGGGNTPIAYGVGTGNGTNIYNEKYKSYLQDAFALPSQGFYNASVGSENGHFGRNNYQFSNPFLTNLDLVNIGSSLTQIHGIRYESQGVVTASSGNVATSMKYVLFNNGVALADYEGALIKPMGAFVIKMKSNTSQNFNFNGLRRFAYNAGTATLSGATKEENAPVAFARSNSQSAARPSGDTTKQLRVIGLDAKGNEVARTYYVVASNLKTAANDTGVQVSAFSAALSTREEMPDGTIDDAAKDKYWLYVNQANEQDFKGKPITMVADLSKIVNYKFVIAENASQLGDNQSILSSGEKFYIQQNGELVAISNNMNVPAKSATANLYYGNPADKGLATNNQAVNSKTLVAFDDFDDTYKVVFAPTWKQANIDIYDYSGRLVNAEKNVNAVNSHILKTSGFAQGVYVVKVTSHEGEVVVQKIIIR